MGYYSSLGLPEIGLLHVFGFSGFLAFDSIVRAETKGFTVIPVSRFASISRAFVAIELLW